MLPADAGDCFLLNFDNGINILIDTGYSRTYQEYLKQKLLELKQKKQCVDLMIITHIDEDHIGGAVAFFKENGYANGQKIIDVKEIWYNSCSHAIGKMKTSIDLTDKQKSILQQILQKQSHNKNNQKNIKTISSVQGDTLAGLLYRLGYADKWNTTFNKKAISIESGESIKFKDIIFHILSPNHTKLENLAMKWKKDLKKRDFKFDFNGDILFDCAYEQYVKTLASSTSYIKKIGENNKTFEELVTDNLQQDAKDTSESNGSSIAFAIEYRDKKLLFLADAHEEVVLDNLKKFYSDIDASKFDVIKLSHHGSDKNNFSLLEKFSGVKYLFSTDGRKNDHPSIKVIAKIIQTNTNAKVFYFNYPIESIKKNIHDLKLKRKYNYTVIQGNNGIKMEV